LHGLGIAANAIEAIKWYNEAAQRGHVQAQYNLGVCYIIGQGVEINHQTGLEWLSRAAAQGHIEATRMVAETAYNIALSFENGEEISQDTEKAIQFYQVAAEYGSEEAQQALSRLGVQ
jgi:TPR repeat protein